MRLQENQQKVEIDGKDYILRAVVLTGKSKSVRLPEQIIKGIVGEADAFGFRLIEDGKQKKGIFLMEIIPLKLKVQASKA